MIVPHLPQILPLPMDCITIVCEFYPLIVEERCARCAHALIMLDTRGRCHHVAPFACTESLCVCEECFVVEVLCDI